MLQVQRCERLVFSQPVEGIVPVPRHWWTILVSGLDAVTMIGEELGKLMAVPVYPHLIRRTTLGQPQRELPLTQRFENARRLFQLGPARIAAKHLIVVDDVLTSGATMSVIAGLLKEAGVKEVTAVALARAEGQQ
jgi:predicted amidophosphoribosyltransferase